MTVVLVTGMSGAGESTVLAELARRGHAVVDTDRGDWTEHVPVAGQDEPEPLWRGAHHHAPGRAHRRAPGRGGHGRQPGPLLPALRRGGAAQRAGGGAPRPGRRRVTNDFGRTADERRRIIRDTAEVEPLRRARATVEVDTHRPLPEVVAAVLAAATGSP